jgi:hypothetical protein
MICLAEVNVVVSVLPYPRCSMWCPLVGISEILSGFELISASTLQSLIET